MKGKKSVFWDDLNKDLKDPAYLRMFIMESIRISTIDSIINQLDEVRSGLGLSKAELARKLGSESANVRRFFASGPVNPTLSTLAEIAAALGMRVSLEPLPQAERDEITKALSYEPASAKRLPLSSRERKSLPKHGVPVHSA